MNKLRKTLCLTLLTISTASCSTSLPADFPKPIAINLCSPVVKSEIFDKDGKSVPLPNAFVKVGKDLKPIQLSAAWVICERTDTREKTSADLKSIQFGISAEDWNRGQEYRRLVEGWAIQHGLVE